MQPPQWVLLLVMSTQALPHSIRPAVAQPQTPLVQASAPVGQALQPPQCAIVPSPLDGTQAPPEHMVWPDGHIAMQALPPQTCPARAHRAARAAVRVRRTRRTAPPQFIRPVAHWHVPPEQVRLAPQALPHVPQFRLSVATVLHCPLQSDLARACSCCRREELLVGVAQLEASIRQPKDEGKEG